MNLNQFQDKQLEEQYGRSQAVRHAVDKEEEMLNAQASALQNTYAAGVRVAVSVHAGSQAKLRRSDLGQQEWATILRRIAVKLKENGKDGDYLVFSKEYQQGMVLAYFSRNKVMRLITTLPKGRGNPKPNTKKLFVESLQQEYDTITVD